MATKSNTETTIHALAAATIGRQIELHTERRRQITNERATMYASSLKNGGNTETPVVDDDERAAREHAKTLLNGAAPDTLSIPPAITRDKILYREMRGIDIALKILADKSLVARAAAAVEWAEAHRGQWRALCREITLTAIKIDALERGAQAMVEQCPDIFAVDLPMGRFIGGRAISETPLGDLTEAALAQGVVTSAEIRKAQHVE
jgi:hypothetical protein